MTKKLAKSQIWAERARAAQNSGFDWKKFLRIFTIGIVSALGLDLAGLTFEVYTALVGPIAITVWLQKLIDTAKPQASASPNQTAWTDTSYSQKRARHRRAFQIKG
jgi:hypothetical protein